MSATARSQINGLAQMTSMNVLGTSTITLQFDLARSIEFREGHIPGALWGVRTRLGALRPQLAGAKHVVVTSPDGVAAPTPATLNPLTVTVLLPSFVPLPSLN